ncbi:MAG: hypothetical protein ABH986_04775 [archaeon]
MVAESFSGLLEVFQLLITVLIWVCVAIQFFSGKRNEKILLIVIVIGYLLILYFIENFFFATTIMALWFLFTGTKFFVSKEILFLLFVVLMLLGLGNAFFYILVFVIYTITLSNFIFSTLKKINSKKTL